MLATLLTESLKTERRALELTGERKFDCSRT
jgi:hypothetical protein